MISVMKKKLKAYLNRVVFVSCNFFYACFVFPHLISDYLQYCNIQSIFHVFLSVTGTFFCLMKYIFKLSEFCRQMHFYYSFLIGFFLFSLMLFYIL